MPNKITTLSPLPLSKVKFESDFWSKVQQRNREVTIPAVWQRCKETGRIDAWKLEWQPGMPNEPHIFWDSDVAKWLESAAHSLASHPDPALEAQVDELIDLIASAQHEDGYLNTHFTVVKPQMRWANLRDWHELYCAGHLIEAAVAYQQATGKRTLLEVMCKYADYIDTVFGIEPDKKRGYPGHEEIELALVKLYHATGEQKYLRLSKYFVDERGNTPHYFDQEAIARGDDPAEYWAKTHAYTQSHVPVREQNLPVGHAVRGMYLYCAMADLAVEFQDKDLLAACKRIFEHTVSKRMYVIGGIGSSKANEGYTEDYDLPNESAYAETCAAIALVFFAHRLLQIECDGRYADVMERALYNNVLSGVSLAGDRFFYVNPLASRGSHLRWQWHHCSCCPPNLTRLLASLGLYAYSYSGSEIFVHLYGSSTANFHVDGQEIRIVQKSNYPWDGLISIAIETSQSVQFVLALRIPDWCRHAKLRVNRKNEQLRVDRGYAMVAREWQNGDQVELLLKMPVEAVHAHPAVQQNAGKIALQRGPLVFCLEEADNGKNLNSLAVNSSSFQADFNADLLGGTVVLQGKARQPKLGGWANALYRFESSDVEEIEVLAIPYFLWANREPGEMIVWLNRDMATQSQLQRRST